MKIKIRNKKDLINYFKKNLSIFFNAKIYELNVMFNDNTSFKIKVQ